MSGVQLVKLSDVVFEKALYPRNVNKHDRPFWTVVHKYALNMEAGAVFPPIVLWPHDGKKILIDGWHRVLANRDLGKKEIEAQFIRCEDYEDAFEKAFAYNIVSKEPLSMEEIGTGIARMRLAKRTYQEIARLTQLTVPKVKEIEAERIIWHEEDHEPKSFVVVKKLLMKTATRTLTKEDQDLFVSRDQLRIVQELNALIERNLIDIDNKEIVKELEKLVQNLRKLMRL